MKQIVRLSFCLLFSTAAFSQTSVIAHRSHSGSMRSFNPHTIADNLGWTGFERQNFELDTSALARQLQALDTTSTSPYCNNPNVSQDSLNKNYPFYTTAMQESAKDSTQKTPAALKEDTLAKPKERIKSRSEVKTNELIPIGSDFYGNPTNPPAAGIGFVLTLVMLMALVGSIIWFVNRKKVANLSAGQTSI